LSIDCIPEHPISSVGYLSERVHNKGG
jgi:hypothetical protein